MSKEEREQRDLDQCPKRRRTSDYEGGEGSSKEDIAFKSDPTKSLRPGDPGWVPRARVPMPSNKDYVVRPKWKVDTEIRGVSCVCCPKPQSTFCRACVQSECMLYL